MSCPNFRHDEPFVGQNTDQKRSNSLLKRVFFVFPALKIGRGVPTYLQNPTCYPYTLVGTLVAILDRVLCVYTPPTHRIGPNCQEWQP